MLNFFPSRTIALDIFGFEIHWYGVLYVVAFWVAWMLLPRLQKYRNLTISRDEWLSIMTWGIAGVLIGGRLGYVLFYEPTYFMAHPTEIFSLWRGGMSSHGGFIGVTIALWVKLRRSTYSLLDLSDVVVVPVAIGLALGRVGNFINQELYGTVTHLPWGIQVPDVEGLRHPVQLYAVMKNVGIAAACYLFLVKKTSKPGQPTALFLMLYGVLRFIVEYFRDQEWSLAFGYLTRGQLLTIPVFMIGAWLFWKKGKKISM